jgi:hypothetical protein
MTSYPRDEVGTTRREFLGRTAGAAVLGCAWPIRDVTCKKAKYALNLRGFSNAPIRGVRLERCTFDNVARPDVVENVEGLTLTEVKVNGKTGNHR